MGSRSCLRDAASSWIPRPLSHPSFLPACTSFANTSRFHLTYRRNSRYTYTKHQATCDAQSKPSPVCAVHTIFLPLCWAFHMRSFSLLVGFIEAANGIACPPPKERILSTHNCFKTFTHLHDGAAIWSTWQARNVLLFCSLEDRPRASAWLGGSCLRPTFLRPLLLIREIKKTSARGILGGGCAKEEKEQTQLFSYVALDTDVENKHKSDKTRLK